MTVDGSASGGLRRRSARAILWIALPQVGYALLLVAIPAIVARTIDAREIGALDVALGFYAVAVLFVELGMGPAIIQRPRLDDAFLTTVLAVNVATGLLFATALWISAPLITRWFGFDTLLTITLRAIALAMLPMAFAIVPRNLLARQLAFGRLSLAQGVATAAAGGAAAVVFRSGSLASALAAGVVAFASALAVGVWIAAGWRPTGRIQLGDLPHLLRFSIATSAARMLDSSSAPLERFLIAALLGPAALGTYALARTLMRGPLRQLMTVFDTVLLPGLALAERDGRHAAAYYLAAVRCELALFGPLFVFVGVFATEIVAVLYGDRWPEVPTLVLILLPFAWRNITGHSVGAVFLSMGRPDVQVRWTIYALGLTTVYVPVGAPWGLIGVATAFAVLDTIGWIVSHTMANRLMGLRLTDFLSAVARPALAHLLLAATLAIARMAVTGPVGVAPGIALLLFGPLTLVLAAAFTWVIDAPLVRSLAAALGDFVGRKAPAATQ